MRGVSGMLGSSDIKTIIMEAKKRGMAESGHKIAFVSSTNEETPDESNMMKILSVE